MEKINYYTIQYRPYKNWGIWKDEFVMTENQLQEFIKSKAEIIKITKHRRYPKTSKRRIKMTGYQKLKKENEILWDSLEGWIRTNAEHIYKRNTPEYEEYINREMAWIEKQIENETKKKKD